MYYGFHVIEVSDRMVWKMEVRVSDPVANFGLISFGEKYSRRIQISTTQQRNIIFIIK